MSYNTLSKPSELKITDIRFADIVDLPKRNTMVKIYTNQDIVGIGEIRDASSITYAAMLKSRLIGENPCDVDRLFRKIKQFGGPSRMAGGVCGIEIALWDLAGKAYGVPVYQMLGGKFRDKVRVYADTDVEGKNHSGYDMGQALKKRLDMGFTLLKMDLGIGLLADIPGALCAPLGTIEDYKTYAPHILDPQAGSVTPAMVNRQESYDLINRAHPFTGIHITEKGLDFFEEYMTQVREVVGYDVPIAIDHFGHVCVEDCIRFAKRMEPYNLAWMEDMVPWMYTDQLVRLRNSTCVPLATGEDIYLKEGFEKLIDAGAVSLIHPDILSCGGCLEMKKIADYADDHGVGVLCHMAESPVAALASVHAAAAMHNVLAIEYHSVDVPWWKDIVNTYDNFQIYENGFFNVPDAPGLGIESFNEELLAEHVNPANPGLWLPTDEWNNEFANDRTWA